MMELKTRIQPVKGPFPRPTTLDLFLLRKVRLIYRGGKYKNDNNRHPALLSPPFLPNQRRTMSATTTRPRSQSHVHLPSSLTFASSTVVRDHAAGALASPASPLVARRLNHSQNLMLTPPPNRSLARQLKLKGSFTDPPHTRRREAFGPVNFFLFSQTCVCYL